MPATNGRVIIESHGPPPEAGAVPAVEGANGNAEQPILDETAKADLTDAERSALLITAYDLDARLRPATSALTVRAQITVRNEGATPLKQLALQLSSTLHWDSGTVVEGSTRTPLVIAQHRLDTDADHTGAANEAILPLAQPLAVGASVALDLFYAGTIPQSAGRLERLGANAAQQTAADWDAITSDWTGMRGFGNVLWYPVASPQLFLAEGNSLFEGIGHMRLREANARIHLRLSVDYTGQAPAVAYFCGRRQGFRAVADAPDEPTLGGAGVAVTDFPAEVLGFRSPSLFLLAKAESVLNPGGLGAYGLPATSSSAGQSSSAAQPGSDPPLETSGGPTLPSNAAVAPRGDTDPSAAPTGTPFLAVAESGTGVEQSFSAAGDYVAPLLREWLGPRPLSVLTAIDHNGQPFQDGPFLVGPLDLLAASTESAALIQSLTHAWVQTGQPWMDEGLGQFFALLWIERQRGRDAANAELHEVMLPVTVAEPEITPGSDAAQGEPLAAAWDDVYYRRKAGAVWWMLRGLVGDGNLHAALSAWRTQPASAVSGPEQALAFEHLLEHVSGKDLHWFFVDWVLRDRGLPDLTITDVAVAPETSGNGHPAGWLVAVTVRNEGGAVAEVPVIVHAGSLRTEQRLRISGQTSATQRILVEATPTSVDVNDGSVPESRTSTHQRDITMQTR